MRLHTISRWVRIVAGYCLAVGAVAHAQDFPAKPITVVVPFPAGGATDVVARAVTNEMSKILGQPMVVDNRPGAGGNVGTAIVAKAAADGYTLAVVGNSFAVNPSLYAQMPFAPPDLRAVAMLGEVPFVMITHTEAPFADVNGLLAYGRGQPERITYASGGNGTVSHLGAHWFLTEADIRAVHVPYRGIAPALMDLMGKQVNLALDTMINSTQLIRQEKVKPLFVTSPTRLPTLPTIPTVAEIGFPGLTFSAWMAMVAPAGTPDSIVIRLNAAANQALRSSDAQKALAAVGVQPLPESSAYASEYLAREISRWGHVVRSSNAKVE